jgi:3'-phosphoadenosine 5'-phosphosulfate sulfotransferase (PAPS reductase)/FAD synthetase
LTTSVSSIVRDEKGRFAKGNYFVNSDWSLPIIDSISDLNLKGIEVICPICNEKGLVITKWVQGKTLKPIHIFHFKNGNFERKCEVDEAQSDQIRGQVKVLKTDIRELMKKRRSFLLFSGGKDSIATLLYLKKISKNGKEDLTVVHVDTTAGLPENTEYVKEVCEYLDVQLDIVRPKIDYFTLAKEWGIPSFGFRWCCRELKIKPIKEYFNSIDEPKVVFDGIRAAESNIRRKYIPIWYHPSFKCLSVSAIFHWTNPQVYALINENGLPKTHLHRLGTSSECWCGAYKTETDFIKLYEINKEMFYKLANLERDSKTGYTYLYNNGQKKTLWDLESQISNMLGSSSI